MDTRGDVARREELGAFLRCRRETLQPEDVGIPRRGRRRVKGLRRYEVAEIAAISVTWYTWIEQGRATHTTPPVIDALARALLLDADGHRHLRRLAGLPVAVQDAELSDADEYLTALVDDLLPHPAHIMTPVADLLAWNEAYARLLTDPMRLEPRHRNGVWVQVMSDELRERLEGWERETELVIANFRAEAGKYPGDARFVRFVDELNEASEFFRNAWRSHRVQAFMGRIQTIHHPEVGDIRIRLAQLRPLDRPHLTLRIDQLADQESRDRMTRLLASA